MSAAMSSRRRTTSEHDDRGEDQDRQQPGADAPSRRPGRRGRRAPPGPARAGADRRRRPRSPPAGTPRPRRPRAPARRARRGPPGGRSRRPPPAASGRRRGRRPPAVPRTARSSSARQLVGGRIRRRDREPGGRCDVREDRVDGRGPAARRSPAARPAAGAEHHPPVGRRRPDRSRPGHCRAVAVAAPIASPRPRAHPRRSRGPAARVSRARASSRLELHAAGAARADRPALSAGSGRSGGRGLRVAALGRPVESSGPSPAATPARPLLTGPSP